MQGIRVYRMCSACLLTLPRMDTEEWSQWQNEFRGQIRALRHWLKSMEMRLPPVDPAVSSTG